MGGLPTLHTLLLCPDANTTQAVQLKGSSGGFLVHHQHHNGLGMERALLTHSGEKEDPMTTMAHTLLSSMTALPCDGLMGREKLENTQQLTQK